MKKLSDFVWWNKNRPNHSAAENAQIAEPFEELDDQVFAPGRLSEIEPPMVREAIAKTNRKITERFGTDFTLLDRG